MSNKCHAFLLNMNTLNFLFTKCIKVWIWEY